MSVQPGLLGLKRIQTKLPTHPPDSRQVGLPLVAVGVVPLPAVAPSGVVVGAASVVALAVVQDVLASAGVQVVFGKPAAVPVAVVVALECRAPSCR